MTDVYTRTCISGFNRCFWSWSKDSGPMDQRGDTHSSPVTGFGTRTQSSTTSRCVSLLECTYVLYLIWLLSEWTPCCLSGVEHYDDLNQPVSMAEADAVGEIVEKAVVSVLPGAQITLTGGFRRWKSKRWHAVFLMTSPSNYTARDKALMSGCYALLLNVQNNKGTGVK